MDKVQYRKGPRMFSNGVCIGGSILLLAIGGGLMYDGYKHVKTRDDLIIQIYPYVEMVDKKQGISFEDQIDFAIKARIPTETIREGVPFNFRRASTLNLEQALALYKSK